MYGFRIIDGRLTAPGYDYQPGEGVHVCADLRAWLDVGSLSCPVLDSGQVREATAEEMAPWFPPPVVQYSKLKVGRMLRAQGWLADFLAFLDANDLRFDWDNANVLASDDDEFMSGISAFAQAKGATIDQVLALLEGCRSED
jgi:hypothetical protein